MTRQDVATDTVRMLDLGNPRERRRIHVGTPLRLVEVEDVKDVAIASDEQERAREPLESEAQEYWLKLRLELRFEPRKGRNAHFPDGGCWSFIARRIITGVDRVRTLGCRFR